MCGCPNQDWKEKRKEEERRKKRSHTQFSHRVECINFVSVQLFTLSDPWSDPIGKTLLQQQQHQQQQRLRQNHHD